MKYKNLSDSHTHSNRSFDAFSSSLDMCKKAKELNLLHYTITDHCEIDEYFLEKDGYKSVADLSYEDMISLKEQFPNLLVGVEFGQPTSDEIAYKTALENKKYDFIIGSLHRLRGLEDFYYWSDLKTDTHTVFLQYFKELTEMVESKKFDTLAHLSYPLRYVRDEKGNHLTFDGYRDEIAALFKIMIEKNVALELNTSGLRQKIGEFLPNEKIIRLYKDLGGKLLTVGSDAHKTDDLAKGVEEALDLLSEIGYKHFTVYKERKPMMIDIK